jgi:hypothetical protein
MMHGQRNIKHVFRFFKCKFLVMANGKSVSLHVFVFLQTLYMDTTELTQINSTYVHQRGKRFQKTRVEMVLSSSL